MVDKARRHCLFCNKAEGRFSNEHVIPQWLQRHLGISKLLVSPTHRAREKAYMTPAQIGKSKPAIVNQRKLTPMNIVSGEVCETCNNGWMASLEDEMTKILPPVVDGEKEIMSLGEDEIFKVARWVAKTAYTYSWSANYERIVPKDHLHFLYQNNNRLPDGVSVFAFHYNGQEKFRGRQCRTWLYQDYPKDMISEKEWHSLCDQSYKISFLFDNLLLLITYWPPIKNWLFLANPNCHARLLWSWNPKIATNLSVPKRAMGNSMEAHLEFHLSLGISFKIIT